MLSFRYHIISLTAVFLALAIGVITGATVVDKHIITLLNGQVDDISARNRELRDRTDVLERQVAMWGRFGDASFAREISGALRGARVLRVISGAPEALVNAVDATLRTAGATSAGTLVLTDRWALGDERARIALGGVLAVPTRDPGELWRGAGERLAARLRAPADPRGETDLLRLLDDEAFVRLEDVPRGTFPSGSVVVLVLHGGDREIAAPADPFLLALGQGLTGARAVVAEAMGARDRGVEQLRAVVEARAALGTVDHIDTELGRYALVAALVRAHRGGTPLHFGVGERADRLAPEAPRATAPRQTSLAPSPS